MRNKIKKILSQLKTSNNHDDAPATVKQRQLILATSIFVIVVFILWLLVVRSSGVTREQSPAPAISHTSFTSPLEDTDPMTLYLSEIQEKLATSVNTSAHLTEQIESIAGDQQQISGQIKSYESTLAAMQAQLKQYNEVTKEKMQETPFTQDKMATFINESDPLHQELSLAQPHLNDLPTSNNPKPIANIQVLDITLIDTPSATTVKTSADYIPPGTFVRAVMLNGLDADTSVSGQGDPKPVVMRITGWGNLPNHYKSRLKDCVVVGAGIGDISSERAYIRLDTLSCVLNDGKILDVNAFGHVVDHSDGKVGVKGKLRMGAAKLVSNAFFAGVVSGLGNGVSQQYMTTYSSALGQTSALDPSSSLQYGLASGIGETGNRMADYFIRRADQYNPIVQVPPQAVDIIFIKQGIWLNESASSSVVPVNNNNPIDNRVHLREEIKQATALFNQNP